MMACRRVVATVAMMAFLKRIRARHDRKFSCTRSTLSSAPPSSQGWLSEASAVMRLAGLYVSSAATRLWPSSEMLSRFGLS